MSEEIKRATGLLILEVVNSNPNGDPDRESDPRQRPNELGEISPVSFKRKLRDLLEDEEGVVYKHLSEKLQLEKDKYQILESKKIGIEVARKDIKAGTFKEKYWDGRVFGNTILEKEMDKDTIKTGVVQFVVGVSISKVNIQRHTNTQKVNKEDPKKSGGMSPLAYRFVEHGVYVMPFYINPSNAHKSGCTAKDIDLLKALIPYAYDHTRSAIRPDVRIRHAWYMEHKNSLGSCPDYLLVETLTPKRKGTDPLAPSTCWADYDDETARLPKALEDKLGSKCIDLMETV